MGIDRVGGRLRLIPEQDAEDACEAPANGAFGHAQLRAELQLVEPADVAEPDDHPIVGIEVGQRLEKTELLRRVGRGGCGFRGRDPRVAGNCDVAARPEPREASRLRGRDRQEPGSDPLRRARGRAISPDLCPRVRDGLARDVDVHRHHEGHARQVVVIGCDDLRERGSFGLRSGLGRRRLRRGVRLRGARLDVPCFLVHHCFPTLHTQEHPDHPHAGTTPEVLVWRRGHNPRHASDPTR